MPDPKRVLAGLRGRLTRIQSEIDELVSIAGSRSRRSMHVNYTEMIQVRRKEIARLEERIREVSADA